MQLRSQGLSGLRKMPMEPCQILQRARIFQPLLFSRRSLDSWLICATGRVDTLPCLPLFPPQELFLSGACSSEPLHDIMALMRAHGDYEMTAVRAGSCGCLSLSRAGLRAGRLGLLLETFSLLLSAHRGDLPKIPSPVMCRERSRRLCVHPSVSRLPLGACHCLTLAMTRWQCLWGRRHGPSAE